MVNHLNFNSALYIARALQVSSGNRIAALYLKSQGISISIALSWLVGASL